MTHHLPLPHIASCLAVLSDWQGPNCAGKRGREAGNESDDEAGASKRPRAGVPVSSCCSAQHCHQGTFCGMSCMGSDFLCERGHVGQHWRVACTAQHAVWARC